MIKAESLFAPRSENTLERPLEHLMACHRRIEDRLETLERIAAHWDDAREDAAAALANVIRFFETNGVWHTADEEESVFPRLTPKLEHAERQFLAGLEHDHTTAYELHQELKELAAKPMGDEAWRKRFGGVVERLATLYRRHIEKEDEVLQALGRERLTAEELQAIAVEMKARRGQ